MKNPSSILNIFYFSYPENAIYVFTEYIPTAPQNVKVAVVDDSILVSWSIPLKNAALVEHYDVYYQSTGEADFEATVSVYL